MTGAVINSAYDPDIVRFRRAYLVSYECTIEDGQPFDVSGTSSCVSVYDPLRKELDLARTVVIISGHEEGSDRFTAAAVPELLVFDGRLFLYWSALSIVNGQFAGITVRGTELQESDGTLLVKGSHGRLVHSNDEALTTAVWKPDALDEMSNTTVDLRAVWVAGKFIVAAAGLGGSTCVSPAAGSKGCFRLAVVKATAPLGDGVFNAGHRVSDEEFPSNAQEYTRPVQGPDGKYWFIGHFMRPVANGMSDQRPVPGGETWKTLPDSELLMFPIADESLWPSS